MDDHSRDGVPRPRPDRGGARLGEGERLSHRREPGALARTLGPPAAGAIQGEPESSTTPALPYAEIGGFVARLRQEDSIAARALEFLILTAARLGEALGATWAEIDLGNRIWVVPASRMKAEQGAPGAAVATPRWRCSSGCTTFAAATLFSPAPVPAGRWGRLRSCCSRRSWAVPTCTGCARRFATGRPSVPRFPSEVAEMALAHAVGDAVEQAYRRTDLFDKRRQADGRMGGVLLGSGERRQDCAHR